MSKSYGNYIGITEAPQEMFGKVMSISDELMWRYYELVTDVSLAEIERMKQQVASGEAHPMQLKQQLGKRIVADFHSREAAEQAAQDWSRMFQKDEAPEDLPVISVRFEEVAAPNASTTDGHLQVKLDKLLARTGLATSVTDGLRKVKQGAVRVDGELTTELVVDVKLGAEFTLRAGKKMVKVSVQG
jgi:tyrosyl-tRNA synthetase